MFKKKKITHQADSNIVKDDYVKKGYIYIMTLYHVGGKTICLKDPKTGEITELIEYKIGYSQDVPERLIQLNATKHVFPYTPVAVWEVLWEEMKSHEKRIHSLLGISKRSDIGEHVSNIQDTVDRVRKYFKTFDSAIEKSFDYIDDSNKIVTDIAKKEGAKKWWLDININGELVNRYLYTKHLSHFETWDSWEKAGFPGTWNELTSNVEERDPRLYDLLPNVFSFLLDTSAYTPTTLHELMQKREPGTTKFAKISDIAEWCKTDGQKHKCKKGTGRTKHCPIPVPGYENYVCSDNPGKTDLDYVFAYINDDLQKRNIRDKNGKLIQISGY